MGHQLDGGAKASGVDIEDVSSEFAASFLESFLPVYQMVNQSAMSNVADRYKAIRFAADASLAITASGASWSAALGKTLGDCCGDESPTCSVSSEDRVCRCIDSDASSTGAPSCEDNGIDGVFESANYHGWKGNASSLAGGLSFPVRSRGAGANARKQKFSKAARRRAIFKKLSLRVKNRKRFLKTSWKLSSMRRSRSVAGAQRRLARASRPINDFAARERTFDDSISALQRLIPGGQSMDATVLLDEAVDFVTFLRLQVQALQSVANAVDQRYGAMPSVV